MEPLSALSIATAVVQFLDFAGKVVSGTWSIYRGQPPKGFEDAERDSDVRTIMDSLTKVTRRLQDTRHSPTLRPWSSQDEAIAALAGRCTEVGDQLLELLNRLRSQSKEQFWASFRTALRTIWSEKEVAKLCETLDNYRQQMSMHMLVAMREQVESTSHDQRETLIQTQSICRDVLRKITERAQWQEDVIKAIERSHSVRSRDPLRAAPPGKTHMALNPSESARVSRSVLATIYFPEIDRRYGKITEAYQSTFRWIFQAPTDNDRWTDFSKWGRDDINRLYWVTGKAGAGKSTLMRYIYDHSETRAILKSWAAPRRLITAYFFFWNSGSPMQMSHEGMVRALLYQVLKQAPDLVPIVLPHRMEIGTFFEMDSNLDTKANAFWTWDELLQAFRLLIKRCSKRYRLALFIDGMDEFQGAPSDLIDFISSFNAPGIKVCASSRPWVVFEDAFGHQPHLRLENLTHNDIKHFVTSKLTASPGFRVLQEMDAQVSDTLIENVCQKSSGVFLWVSLVTKSLLSGLSEGERLFELQERLDSLPGDLEKLFENILGRLDAKHFERAAQFFQMVRASLLHLSLLDMSFADEDDLDFAINAPRGSLTVKQVTSRAELMRRRINACCNGLLEAKTNRHTRLPDTKVGYLHRTVKDYLEQQDTSAKLRRASRQDFNVNMRLCNSQIMRLKRQDPETLEDSILWSPITYAIEYAVRADPDCSGCQVALLNEVDKVAQELTTSPLRNGTTYLQQASITSGLNATHWTWTRIDIRDTESFLALAVRLDLAAYVDHSLRSMPPDEIRELVPILREFAKNQTSIFINERDRPVLHGKRADDSVRSVLAEYAFQYPKEMPQRKKHVVSRRRLLGWFGFR